MILRPARLDDGPALVRLFQSAERAEIGRAETSPADVTDLLHAPGLALATRSRVAIERTAIRGLVLLHPAPQPGQLRATLCVDVQARHLETARTLLDLIDSWVGRPPIDVTVFEYPHSLVEPALLAAGWTVVHSYSRMKADLATTPRPVVPDGVVVRAAATQADLATVHAVLEQAVTGHWNHQQREFDEFLADQQRRDGHDASLWLLAEVDGTPAAAVIARAPLDRAWIAWLGTLASYRGCGLATVLLATVFDQLRSRGHDSVGVDVDTHNKTGAGAVYERAGMRVLGAADQWRKSYR